MNDDGVLVHEDISIPVGEEVVAATRYQPEHVDDAVPVLLMYIPYRRADYITYGAYDPLIKYLAKHEYEVVVADMVGTGASTGHKAKPFTPEEGSQGATIVQWLADQTWCDGRVGMFGKSYGGLTSLRTAARNPDPLGAILPIHCSPVDTFDWGGRQFFSAIGDWTPLIHTLQHLPPNRKTASGQWAEVWNRRLEDLSASRPWMFQFLLNSTDGPYWTEMDVPIEAITVPVLGVGGWRDTVLNSTLTYFRKLNSEKKIVIGPWRHTMPHRGRETKLDIRQLAVEWFDHHLKQKPLDGLLRETDPVVFWMARNGGNVVDAGSWRNIDRWPTRETGVTRTLFLRSDGLSSAVPDGETSVETTYEYDYTVGAEALDLGRPIDTTPSDVRSLTFETNRLSDPVAFVGDSRATVHVKSIEPGSVVTVRLTDVSPDGTSTAVTDGQITVSDTAESTGTETLEIPLAPVAHRFDAGHRIRCAISGAYFPKTLSGRTHGSFELQSSPDSPSVIEYCPENGTPVDSPIPVPTGDGPYPATSPYIRAESNTWETARRHHEKTATVRTSDSRTIEHPHGTLEISQRIEAVGHETDPCATTLRTTVEAVLACDTNRIRATTTTHVTRDIATMRTKIHLGDEVYYDQRWTQSHRV